MSLVITPLHIASYSRCPQRTQLLWKQISKHSLSPDAEVVARTIKQIYTRQMEREKIVPWRSVPGLISKIYLGQVGRLGGQPSYQLTKGTLHRLFRWYHDCYLKQRGYTIPNLPIYQHLTGNIIYSDIIDLVEVYGKEVQIIDFYNDSLDMESGGELVLRDLKIAARIWGFFQAMKESVQIEKYVRMIVGAKEIRPAIMSFDKRRLERTRRIVQHILSGIEKGIFYPSVSEQCLKCPCVSQCEL